MRDAATQISFTQSLVGQATAVSASLQLTSGLGPGGTTRFINFGDGRDGRFRVHIMQAFDVGQTLTTEVIVATNSALTTGVVALQQIALASANLTVGREFDLAIPPMTPAFLATLNATHIGLRYSGFAWTTGAVSAWYAVDKRVGTPVRYRRNYVAPGETAGTPA